MTSQRSQARSKPMRPFPRRKPASQFLTLEMRMGRQRQEKEWQERRVAEKKAEERAVKPDVPFASSVLKGFNGLGRL